MQIHIVYTATEREREREMLMLISSTFSKCPSDMSIEWDRRIS